jgi:hypothetical protein
MTAGVACPTIRGVRSAMTRRLFACALGTPLEPLAADEDDDALN